MADNLEITRNVLAAINAHDIEGYLNFIDDSYVAESETFSEPVHGREGARQSIQTLLRAFPDAHFEIEQLLASGDHVVIRYLVTGTHQGTFAGIPATGKKATWRVCAIVEMQNGKAVRNSIFAENLSLLRQLGAIGTPRATTA